MLPALSKCNIELLLNFGRKAIQIADTLLHVLSQTSHSCCSLTLTLVPLYNLATDWLPWLYYKQERQWLY